MKDFDFFLLLLLAKISGLYSVKKTSTSELARLTGLSQQSMSRKLRELEEKKLIERKALQDGIEFSFSHKGREELKATHLELKDLFSNGSYTIKGKVASGLGEGKYYTQLKPYNKQFKELFGKEIHPGTLNLNVLPAEKSFFISTPPIMVEGFSTNERTFGGIDVWRCEIEGLEAAAIIPHRTNHDEKVLELISPFFLRKKLRIGDNDEVKIQRSEFI